MHCITSDFGECGSRRRDRGVVGQREPSPAKGQSVRRSVGGQCVDRVYCLVEFSKGGWAACLGSAVRNPARRLRASPRKKEEAVATMAPYFSKSMAGRNVSAWCCARTLIEVADAFSHRRGTSENRTMVEQSSTRADRAGRRCRTKRRNTHERMRGVSSRLEPSQPELEAFAAASVSRARRLAVIAAAREGGPVFALASAPL
jgi:hypothetical protein